jgi:predicted PurR-regulated permease PerM
MTISPATSSVVRPLLIGAAAVILTAGIKWSAAILNQFFMALFILLICVPLRRWLIRRGMPTMAANTIVIGGVIAIVAALVLFLGASINRLVDQVPTYQAGLMAQVAVVTDWLQMLGIDVSELLSLNIISPARIFEVIIDILGSTLPLATSLVLTLIIFAFGVLDADNFPARLRRGLPPDSMLLARLERFSHSIGNFVRIKALLGAIAAVGNFFLLLFLGVDFPFLWAVVSFFTSFIPYLGYWLALVPPLLLALLEFGWEQALVVLVGFTIINSVADSVLGPKMLGEGMNLSEVATLLMIIYWGWVLGPVGALLALPLTVAVKVLILEPHVDTRWLALALEGGKGGVTDEDIPPPTPEEPA